MGIGWIKWAPTPALPEPIPDTLVLVRKRSGVEMAGRCVKDLSWDHRNDEHDIVAYKVISDNSAESGADK